MDAHWPRRYAVDQALAVLKASGAVPRAEYERVITDTKRKVDRIEELVQELEDERIKHTITSWERHGDYDG